MKAVQQVIGVESVKTGMNKPVGVKFEPAVVKAVQQVNKPRLASSQLSHLSHKNKWIFL